ncbi:hypothetical protein BUALT_Bualt12G0087600 [Buddleja alternifolia]|uniref:ZF-HD dimerization-type domain-containing protein n=1 Tax=Buddleja alternifolia TaxID=168488 RepID=A0AAV6WRC7_9LAMI|nr:hypothetical protein BUALT_Bualt12G0087600 [Buddleja alternifolia]
MGDEYGECKKIHLSLGGKADGCQEYKESWDPLSHCEICKCHKNFHRKVVKIKYVTRVVYTKCHKRHDLKFLDGCQEFTPSGSHGSLALTCSGCLCHKGFHRNEITVEEPPPSSS